MEGAQGADRNQLLELVHPAVTAIVDELDEANATCPPSFSMEDIQKFPVEYGDLGFRLPDDRIYGGAVRRAKKRISLAESGPVSVGRNQSLPIQPTPAPIRLVCRLTFNAESWTFSPTPRPGRRPNEIDVCATPANPVPLIEACANVLAAAVPEDLRPFWKVDFHESMPGVSFTNRGAEESPPFRSHKHRREPDERACACVKEGTAGEQADFLALGVGDDEAWDDHCYEINIPYNAEPGTTLRWLEPSAPPISIRGDECAPKLPVATPEPGWINVVPHPQVRRHPILKGRVLESAVLFVAFPDTEIGGIPYTDLRCDVWGSDFKSAADDLKKKVAMSENGGKPILVTGRRKYRMTEGERVGELTGVSDAIAREVKASQPQP